MWNLLIREKPGPSLMTAASVNKGMCPSKSRSIPIDEICQMPRLRVRRLLEATRAGIPLLARVVCKGHHDGEASGEMRSLAQAQSVGTVAARRRIDILYA